MNSLKIFAVAAAISAFTTNAHADCSSGTQVKNTPANANLSDLLRNHTVCGKPGTGYGGAASDRWQEEHLETTANNGQLYDYKLGPGPSIDPRKKVGDWAVAGTGANTEVTYTYDSLTYKYTVHNNGDGTHSFCDGSSEKVIAKIQSTTNAACTSYP